jgi:hypothetical protein
MKLMCSALLFLLPAVVLGKAPAKANQVPPAPVADEKKPEVDRIPVRAAKDLDYAMISMGYIAKKVLDQKQKEANEEITREQKEDRDKVREIEKLYGVKMFDKDWVRCCDTLDPLTGIVKRGGFKTTR